MGHESFKTTKSKIGCQIFPVLAILLLQYSLGSTP